MRRRRATSASTSAWPRRWPSSRSLAGRTASSAICTPRDVTPSNSTRKRRLSLNAGPKSGHAHFKRRGGPNFIRVGYLREREGVVVGTLASPREEGTGAHRSGTRATQASPPHTPLPPPLRVRRRFRRDVILYLS